MADHAIRRALLNNTDFANQILIALLEMVANMIAEPQQLSMAEKAFFNEAVDNPQATVQKVANMMLGADLVPFNEAGEPDFVDDAAITTAVTNAFEKLLELE